MPEKSKKQSKNPVEEYGKVVDASELEGVNLINLNFDVRPRFFADRDDIELSYHVNVTNQKYDVKASKAFAFIQCSVSAAVDDEDVFSCEGRYIVSYSLASKCDKEAVGTFLKRVATFACYPYFRSVVANLNWAAGTNLPPMPVHRESKGRSGKSISAQANVSE